MNFSLINPSALKYFAMLTKLVNATQCLHATRFEWWCSVFSCVRKFVVRKLIASIAIYTLICKQCDLNWCRVHGHHSVLGERQANTFTMEFIKRTNFCYHNTVWHGVSFFSFTRLFDIRRWCDVQIRVHCLESVFRLSLSIGFPFTIFFTVFTFVFFLFTSRFANGYEICICGHWTPSRF